MQVLQEVRAGRLIKDASTLRADPRKGLIKVVKVLGKFRCRKQMPLLLTFTGHSERRWPHQLSVERKGSSPARFRPRDGRHNISRRCNLHQGAAACLLSNSPWTLCQIHSKKCDNIFADSKFKLAQLHAKICRGGPRSVLLVRGSCEFLIQSHEGISSLSVACKVCLCRMQEPRAEDDATRAEQLSMNINSYSPGAHRMVSHK